MVFQEVEGRKRFKRSKAVQICQAGGSAESPVVLKVWFGLYILNLL